MLTGTPLDLTPFGPLLSALGLLYWVLALGAAGLALWLLRLWWANLSGATFGLLQRWIPTVLVGLTLGACGDPHMEWNEQVKLQSGEVNVVARTAKFSENWVAGGGGGSFNKGMTLRIEQPSKPDNPGVWDARFVPLVLDRDPETQEWFIVATFFHCDSWYDLGRPKLPYTEYRFRNGHWIQQTLTQKWLGREANVLPVDLSNKTAIAESKPALTVERKEGMLYNPAIPSKYKRVIDEWTSGC